MKIECPACHNMLEGDSDLRGQKAQCPYCGNKFVVSAVMLKPAAPRSKSKWRYAALGAAAVLCVVAGVGLGRVSSSSETSSGSAPAIAPENNAVVHAEVEKSAASAVETKNAADAAAASAVETEKSASTGDATDENTAETSQDSSEQSSEDTTTDVEEGDYTYVYYEGECVPYYRGYYYIDGVWVWRRHGRAPYPPPKFRPALARQTSAAAAEKRSGPVAKKASAPKSAAGRSAVKSAPAKASHKAASKVKRSPAKSTTHHHGGGRSSAPRPRR